VVGKGTRAREGHKIERSTHARVVQFPHRSVASHPKSLVLGVRGGIRVSKDPSESEIAMSQGRDRQRRKKRDISHSSQLQEQISSQVARPEQDQPGQSAISQLQDTFGNQFVLEALSQQGQQGPGALAAEAIQLGIAGVDAQEQLPATGSMSVLRAQLHADLRGGSAGVPATEAELERTIRRTGRPLPPAVQARMEAAFGHDFSHVRIHTDSAAARAAADIQARAFAVGSDVFFAAGTFSPDTHQGQEILAHELAHVEQADQGRLPTAGDGLSVSSPSDKAEVEAVARARVVTGNLNILSPAELTIAPPAMEAATLEASERAPAAESAPAAASPAATVMRDARSTLSGLSRQLSERSSRRRESSSRRSASGSRQRQQPSGGRQQPASGQRQQSAPGQRQQRPERSQQRPDQQQRGTAPDASELLANALATAIVEIMPPELEGLPLPEGIPGLGEQAPEQGGRGGRQARGGAGGEQRPAGDAGAGQQRPGPSQQRPGGEQQGAETELTPEERLERFVTGQIIEPAVAEVGLRPEHVQQALGVLRPTEQGRIQGRAQQRDLQGPDVLLGMVPEALDRAAPVLDQLRAEAGENVERPDPEQVDRARRAEGEPAAPPVVIPEPTVSTEPGPSSPPQSRTQPSQAAPATPQRPSNEQAPADQASELADEQEEIEELLEQAEQEAEEATQATEEQQQEPETEPVPTGRGRASSAQQSYEQQRDYLEAEIHKVEIDLEWNESDLATTGGKIDGKQDRISDAQGRMDDNDERKQKRRELVEGKNEQARAQNKAPTPPDKDSQLRFHELKGKRFPQEMKGYEQQVKRLKDETDKLNQEQERLNELMTQLQEELNDLEPPGGGAAHGPENVPKICEQLGEQIDRKKTETQRTVDTLTRERDGLQEQIDGLTDTLTGLETEYQTSYDQWRDTQDDIDRVDAGIGAQQSSLEPGQSAAAAQSVAPASAGDTTSQSLQDERSGLETLLDTLENAWRTEIPARERETESQKLAAETELRTKTTELTEAEREIELMDLAITTLEGGTLLYQQIAARFGLHARIVYYPVGHRPWSPDDEFRTPEQMEAERQLFAAQQEEREQQQSENNPAGDITVASATEDDRERDERFDTDNDSSSTRQTSAERREERERQEQAERDALLRDISAARGLPPEERARRLEQLGAGQSPRKTPEQLGALLDQNHSDVASAIASNNVNLRAPIELDADALQRTATQAGVSVEALQRWSEEQVRRDHNVRAARYLGLPPEQAQEAGDRLATLGHARGLSGPEMLNHLAFLPPGQHDDEEMAALARQVQSQAFDDPEFTRGRPNGMSVEAWREQQAGQARTTQQGIAQRRAIAASMNIPFQEVDGYVEALRTRTGLEADQVRELLAQGGPAQGDAQSLTPEQINARLENVGAGESGEQRLARLRTLAGQIPPDQLMGALLAQGEQGHGLVEGPVANSQLDSRLDAIAQMPMQQQWEAYANLSRMTGIQPDELMRSQRNRDTRDQALNGVGQIRTNRDLSPQERERRLGELAERMNLTRQQLEEAYTASILATQAALARAAGRSGALPVGPRQAGDPLTVDLFGDIDESNLTPVQRAVRELQTGNLTGPDAEIRLQRIAAQTGLDPADLRRFSAVATQEHNQREWGARLGQDNARQLETWAEQRGITPDQMMDHLRRLPPNQCPPEMREAQQNLARWDRENAGENQHQADVDELARMRRAAGLHGNAAFVRIHTNPADIDAIEDETEREAARARYNRYIRRRDALINKLDETWVEDDDAISLLAQMTPAERAALMRDPAAVDEDGYDIRTSFSNGVGGSEHSEGMAIMNRAEAYNTALASDLPGRVQQATQDAIALEQRTQQTMAAATALGTTDEAGTTTPVSQAEATARIDALARHNNVSREEAVRLITSSNDPQSLFAPMFTVDRAEVTRPDGSRTTRVRPSQTFRDELTRVNALPAEERRAAIERLQSLTGMSDEDMRAARGEVVVENHVVTTLHQAQQLPESERARVMERLEEETGRTASELQGIFERVQQEDRTALSRAPQGQTQLQRLVECPIGDLQNNAEEVARQIGMPVETVLRLAQAQRATARPVSSFVGQNADAQTSFVNEAQRRNMSPEQFADYLARAPENELPTTPTNLRELRRSVLDSGYQVQRTESEQERRRRALGNPNDTDYIRQRNILFNQLTHDCSDEAIINALQAMTPAQRRMFFEEWEARRTAEGGGTIGGGRQAEQMQPIRDQLRDALQGGDETRGLALLDEAMAFNPEESLQVDVQNPQFVENRDQLLREIQPPGRPDPDRVRELFNAMSPAERAQYLRDEQQLINAATAEKNDGRRTQSEIPRSITEMMRSDHTFQVRLRDAQSLNQDRGTQNEVRRDLEDTRRVETQVAETDRAVEALNWTGDRQQAYQLLQSMAQDYQLSNENMLRMLEGRALVDDTDQTPEYIRSALETAPSETRRIERGEARDVPTAGERSATQRESRGDTLAGYTMDTERVSTHQTQLQSFLDGDWPRPTPRQIADMLQGCNPRELAELDRRLQPGGLASLSEVRRDERGRILPRLFGPTAIEVGALERRAQDYNAIAREDALVLELSANDPRSNIDPSTPDGLAQRMAWARGLPPEQRIAELNRLQSHIRRDGPVNMAETIAQAYLGGSLGGSSQVMRPALLAQVQAAENLPFSERQRHLEALARLSGHGEVNELQQAASRSQANLRALTEFQRVEDLPEHERLAEINRLCQSTGMTEAEMRLLLEQAENSGVLDRPLQELSDEAERELDRIKDIADPDERRAALENLGAQYGLTNADMIAHLNQQASEARTNSQLRVNAERQAQEIHEKIRGGDEDEIRAIMERYGNDPANFQRILSQYPGGIEALQRSLRAEFGRNDPDNIDFLDMIDRAENYTPAPELPPGVDSSVSERLRDLMRRHPETDDPDQQRERDAAFAEFRLEMGLSASAFDSVKAHAEHTAATFEQDLTRAVRAIEAETNSWYVDDERMREIIMGASPELIHALRQRYPDLMNEALEGTGGDTYADIEQQYSQASTVMGLPYDERSDRIRDMRVEYKASQLEDEFDSWFWNDSARVRELLADCSDEELRLLDARFGGQLAEKIEEVSKPTIFQSVVTAAVFIANPLYGYLIFGNPFNYEDETEMAGLQGAVRQTRNDADGGYSTDQSKVNAAVASLRDELDSTLWVSDNKLLSIMSSLNPAELMALRAQIEGDGPNSIPVYGENGERLSFREILEANMSGDTQAKAIAMLADAEDAAAGRNRREEMHQQARDMAIKQRMDEIAKSAQGRGKSPEELYRLATADQGLINKLTQDKVKKIQDSANSLFKAIDGWGDDEKTVLKTLAGLTPEEIELVKVEYRRHFGKDLETQMREDMGLGDWKPSDGFEPGGFWESSFTDHNEGKMALMMMSKEHRAEGVQQFLLEYSDRACFEDEDLIFQTLENMSVEERTKIVTMPGSEDFIRRLKRDLGTHEAQMVDALIEINPETGKAEANKAHVAAVKMKMAMHGSGDWWDFSSWGTDENDFLKQLDGLTPEEVQAAVAYYNANLTSFGSFQEEVMSDFGRGADYEVIQAELRGDKVQADVMRLEYAAAGWGTDEKLIEETLAAGREGRGGRTAEHLSQVRGAFDATFGRDGGKYADRNGTGQSAMDIMLGQETQGMERVYFQQMAEKGKADDEVTLLYAMNGWGTDEEKVKKVIEGQYNKSPQERAAFAARFREMSVDMLGVDQSLEEWIEGDFSGTEGFEMKLQLMGQPQTPEEYLERARMRYEFERGGLWNQLVGNVFMDGLEALGAHSNGSLLVKQMGEIESMFGPDGKLKDPQKFEDLKELCEWEAQDAKRYRETRDKVADAVSATIQVVGAVVVTVVTAGAGSGVLVAVIANLAVSLAATAVKAAMKGGGYGVEELGMDLANAVVSAGFAGVGALRAGATAGGKALMEAIKAGKKLSEIVTKEGIKAFMKEAMLDLAEGAGEGLLKALINSEGALAQGDAEFFKYLLKETAMGGIRKVATTAIGKGMGKTPLGKKLAEMDAATQGTGALLNKGSAAAHLGLKYADSVLKGIIPTALDHNKWEAWAKGEGFDFNLLKALFIDKAVESIIEVGARRTTAYQKYWAAKNLKKAQKESDELWSAYKLAKETYDDEAMIEQVFGPKLEANQQAIMIGEQNVGQLNRQIADENEQAIAQHRQNVQRVSDELDNESNRRLSDNPEGDAAAQDAMRDVARRMVDDAETVADDLAQGRRPADRRRGDPDLDDGSDAVITRRIVDVGDEDQDTAPIKPKRTIPVEEAEDIESTQKTNRRKPIDQEIEELGEGPERWAAFRNFGDLADEKASIIGAKALGDDGEFSPALKAKLEKLGYTVRKDNVIARQDTGEQVPLHLEEGRIVPGLKRNKTGRPTHLANELLPGGATGAVWKAAKGMVDQEIVLADGRKVKVTRVMPTVVREGVDSEGGAIISRRIAMETDDGEVVYRPISDFEGAAPATLKAGKATARKPGEDVDPAPVVRALEGGDTAALTGGDPATATQVFSTAAVRKAVNQAFVDLPDSPTGRLRQVKTLMDSFGGDFETAHQAFSGPESHAVRKAINAHRGKLVGGLIAEVQEAFPGLKVNAKRLDPNAPTLSFEFEGAQTAHARAFLEQAAMELFGGSLKQKLGVELSEAPVRLRADADVEGAGTPRKVAGEFNDPISYEENGVTRYFSDGKGGKWGYSTAFGFAGDIDSDGAFVIKQKVVLVADDLDDAGVQRVKSDVEAANATYYNDPKHRIVVDDMERPLRQVLDVEIITKAEADARKASRQAKADEAAARGEAPDPGIEPVMINVHKGKGRADSSNLYTEGPDAPATDQYRQMVIAHELAHAIWGLADRYEDYPQKVKNPAYDATRDPPEKEFINIRSEARKGSRALHVSREGGLMEDFNVAFVQGKVPLDAAKSWDDLGAENWQGLQSIYEASNKAMPTKSDGSYDWGMALKSLNTGMRDEQGGYPRTVPAGAEVVLPKLTAPKGWGVSSGNLKQLEWTIGQAKRGRVNFELGDGSEVDRVVQAEKGQVYAQPKQEYSQRVVDRAKKLGYDLDALSPSAISATRGRPKQRRSEIEGAKALGGELGGGKTAILPAVGAKTSKLALAPDADVMAPEGARASRQPTNKTDKTVLPPSNLKGAKRTVDLARSSNKDLEALGLSKREITAIRKQTRGSDDFDMESFVKANPKLSSGSLGKIARLTGNEDAAVALMRQNGESDAETAHRLGLDHTRFGTQRSVEDVAELHNHFKGVLDPEDYPRLLYPAEHAADPDVAAKLTLQKLRQFYDDNFDEVAFDPKTKAPKVSAELVQKIINGPDADVNPMATLRRVMRASAEMPFDYTYDPRGAFIKHIQAADKAAGLKGDKARMYQFVEATVERLAKQGIRYVELQGKLNAPGISDADFEAITAKHGIFVRMLPHLLTNQMAVDKEGAPTGRPISKEQVYKMLGKDPESNEPISKIVAGLDICGPEKGRWSKGTIGQVDIALEALALESDRAGRPMVLRPHVGEGYSENSEVRRHGGGDRGEVAQISRNNLKVLLDHLENSPHYKPPPEGKVVVRLGHVTHATDKQIEQMRKLGVIAEVNIGSNLATGSLPRDTNANGRLDEHPLLKLMIAGVKTTLSTDAQGVMSTSMGREFGFADDMIQDFVSGRTTVTIRGKTLRYQDLTPEQQRRVSLGTLHSEGMEQVKRGMIGADILDARGEIKPGAKHMLNKLGYEYDEPTRRIVPVASSDLEPLALQGRTLVSAKAAPSAELEAPALKLAPPAPGMKRPPPAPAGKRPPAPKGPIESDEVKGALKLSELELTGPTPGKRVTEPEAGDTPLIGLANRTFDPELTATELAAEIRKQGVPRQRRLNAAERKEETDFATMVEADPESFIRKALAFAQENGSADSPEFEVDGMKRLMAAYGAGSKPADDAQRDYRLTMNHALHPTAVAIARMAFVARLDQLAKLPPDDPARQVFITNGGCGAGKSDLAKIVKGRMGPKAKFGAVWDAAGEGDALETSWILQAAQARGLKTVVGYAEADPEQRFEGVLDRAASKARVVDVMTFVNSYADGQTEMKRFLSSPEFEAARKAGMVEAYGILPGKVHPTKFKLGDAGKHLPTFPWLEDLNPQGGQLRAEDVGRLPTNKAKALKSSLKTLEDYVQKQYEAGKDPSTVVKGALGNALKFLPEQTPEIQDAILDTHDRIQRILSGKTVVERKPATLKEHDSVLSPALERLMELDFDTVKKITEDYSDFLDNKPSHLPDRRSGEVFSEMVGQAAVKPLPHVDIEDDGAMAYMEKGRKEYARYKQKAIVEGMDDDSIIMLRDRPEGAQDFDGLVPQKSGKVKDTDILFKYSDGRRIITDPDGNITTVLSDFDIADYRVKGQWAGDATLEGEDGAGSRINKNLGVDGIQHGMLTRGLSHPDKARKVIEKLAKPDADGKFTDPDRVIDMLRAEVYVFEKSGSHKGFRAAMPMVEALKKFNPEAYETLAKVLPPELAEPAGITPQRVTPGEAEALRLANEALHAPPPGMGGKKAPNAPMAPKAPRGPAGWDDELEITGPMRGTRKAPTQGDELEVTADLPGSTPQRGFHDDITADLPAPSRGGPRARARDVETFKRNNMNYDFYEEDVDRLLRKRPELKQMMDEHGLSYEEVVAVYAYSRQDYADINTGLRGQDPEQLEAYRAQIAVTNSALSKLPPARGSVFRRVQVGDWLDEYQEGAVVTEKAYTSTSNDYDTMLGHAGKGSVEFVMRSRTGRDITQLSGKGELENEVLFAPGTRFRVSSRKVDADGTVVIYMDEEVSQAAPAAGALAPQAPGGKGKGAAKKRRRKAKREQEQAQQEQALTKQTERTPSTQGRTTPKRQAPLGELDLDTADLTELKAHGLSAKQARKIISFREQEGSFDFATFAALHPDFDAGVVAKAARSSGREAEAVAAVRKEGEHEAEAAQRVGIDPRDFGRKVDIRGVAELHNHFKGILEAEDFPKLLFPDISDETEAAARTVDMLRRLYKEDPDNELRAPHKIKATELVEKILHSGEADSDPVHTLRRVMTAGNDMPFDYTYDPRGLLIDSLKGRGKEGAEAFVRATAKRLADQGITYAELQGKISTPGLDEADFQRICAEHGIKIRLLPQLLTHQFSGDEAAGFTDDKLLRLMLGDDYSHAKKVPDLVGGVDICGPEAGRWSAKGMDHLERAFGLLETEAQLSGRQLVLRPHVGEGYSGTSGQRRLGVEENAAQAETARHNLDMILGRLEKMGYEPPPAGKVQIRLGHVTAATAEQARKMAELGVIAEVNIGSNMVTGALRRGKGAEGDRLDEHPLPTLLYYGVKTVLSTDAQGVMATNLPKEYGYADTIIQRFRGGEGRIKVPDPDNPGDHKILAWKDLSPEQQERFDVEWLARQARHEASVGRWDGGHRGPTSGLKVKRAKLTHKRADWLRTSTLHGQALRRGEGPNQREELTGDRIREELARNRDDAPALMEELLKRQPPDAPRGAVVMNLIQASGIAFEDLMAAVSASGSEDLSGAMAEFQEQLLDFLQQELRKHHPNTRIRAAGKGSSRMELVVEGAEEREAKSTLEQLCEHSYGREWERTLGVKVREPAQPAR
jgi:DNA uptake protein ComE-like DNA-binding protein